MNAPPSDTASLVRGPADLAVWRILDANSNRAAEGLRVLEEYVRFAMSDRLLAESCKQLRHDLAVVLSALPTEFLLSARDVAGDVGTTIQTATEYQRSSLADLARANFKRVEQALRCLEEYSKLVRPEVAAGCEQLRYRTYGLAKAFEHTCRGTAALSRASLYVLVDAQGSLPDFRALVTSLIAGGVQVLQLRDKHLRDRDLLQCARVLRDATRGTDTRFIMNDRPDLAVLAEADGVHVGQEELGVAEVRQIVGPEMLVGVSTHSLAEARQAVRDGADYLGCGPTFPSETKSFAAFPGVAFLREVAAEITVPAFAIGGIHAGNVDQVLAAGFRRIAVGAAVTRAPSPETAARQLLRLLATVPQAKP